MDSETTKRPLENQEDERGVTVAVTDIVQENDRLSRKDQEGAAKLAGVMGGREREVPRD